jgi:1-acyl-sn-glycerol-3-phosphate acyltransferase
LLTDEQPLGRRLAGALRQRTTVEVWSVRRALESDEAPGRAEALVYLPALPLASVPAAGQTARVCAWARGRFASLLLLSTTGVVAPGPDHPGLVEEGPVSPLVDRHPWAGPWASAEVEAREALCGETSPTRLTVLRVAATPVSGGRDLFSRLLSGFGAVVPWGHDPPVQLLDLEDLAEAILRAAADGGELHNVVPAGVAPLRATLRLAGVRAWPLPVAARRLGALRLGAAARSRAFTLVDYLRYSWTASGKGAEQTLGFRPRHSTVDVARRLRAGGLGVTSPAARAEREFDPFGMDEDYIRWWSRTVWRFLHRYYWRVVVQGDEHVPRNGAAVLVGSHRGLMPWDAIMVLHHLVERHGRFPRFLVHPGLLKFPFSFDHITRLGGVIACQRNADIVLESGELVGVFPEGVRGAFSPVRGAYRLKSFGSHDYVRFSLRHRVPIVPLVTLGSAEVFPILARIGWGWWRRYSLWPCLPVAPNFPWLPLPTKWHTRFLPPLEPFRKHPPQAAEDHSVVSRIGRDIRRLMQSTLDSMLVRRRSWFHGSVFTEGPVS